MKQLFFIALFFCAACSTSGKRITEAQLMAFEKGVTHKADVEAALGKPITNSILPDDSSMSCYNYQDIAVRPETFIPIVGAVVGGANVETQTTCFQFDSADILMNYTMHTAQQI